MDKIKKIHDLMDGLMEAIKDAFPEATKAMVSIYADGYRNIDVEQWADADGTTQIPDMKRRVLLDQSKIRGEWYPDRSKDQNKYYKLDGLLLEKENEHESAS